MVATEALEGDGVDVIEALAAEEELVVAEVIGALAVVEGLVGELELAVIIVNTNVEATSMRAWEPPIGTSVA